MIKISRLLDITKIVECRHKIVFNEKGIFNTGQKAVFRGSDLIDWLIENHNPLDANREGLAKLINDELFDPTLPLQAIYPAGHDQGFLDSKKHLYRFLEDQYIEYKKDSHIINLHGLETSQYQLFFEGTGAPSIYDVIKEFNEVVLSVYEHFVEQNGKVVNYDELADSEFFNSNYIPLATKLAYTDISPLIENEDLLRSFWINVYNMFSIHLLICKFRKKGLSINMIERLDSFNSYKYTIGGHNYSLNDIHHGILRKNDSTAGNMAKVIVQFVIDKRSKELRFKENDPRYKFVLRNFDPRVNFALNYGAVSCPTLIFYNYDTIDEQLEDAAKLYCTNEVEIVNNKGKPQIHISQLFKYYNVDFGTKNKDVLEFILKYNQSQVAVEEIKKALAQDKINIEYKKFNLDPNNKKDAEVETIELKN